MSSDLVDDHYSKFNNDKNEKYSPDDCIIIYEQLLVDQMSSRSKCLQSIENTKGNDDFYGICLEKSTKNISGLTNFIKTHTTKSVTKDSYEPDEDSDSNSDILDIFPSPSVFYKEICAEYSNENSYPDSFPMKQKLSKRLYGDENDDVDDDYDYLNLNTSILGAMNDKENLFLYKCKNDITVDNIEDLELSNFIMNMSVNDNEEIKQEGQRNVIIQGIGSPINEHSCSITNSQKDIMLMQTSTPKSNICKQVSRNYQKNFKERIKMLPTRKKEESLYVNIHRNNTHADQNKIIAEDSKLNSKVAIEPNQELKDIKSRVSTNSSTLQVSEAESCSISDDRTQCKVNNDESSNIHTATQMCKQQKLPLKLTYGNCHSNISYTRKEICSRTKLEFNKKKIDENSISQEKETKAYKKPFKSDNEYENQDINNPNWDIYRKLKTDEERYYIVRKHWRSVVVPDPNENLTFHNFRRRQIVNNGGKVMAAKNKQSRKRFRESDEGDGDLLPASKRTRLFTDVDFNARAIQNTLETLEQNYEDELRVPQNADIIRKLDNAYREYCLQLQNARLEAEMVHKFYTGLPNQKVLTQREIEMEQWDIEDVYRLFKRYYNWSGKVFNPVIRK